MNITPQDFDFVRKLVCDQAGIILDPGKEYLVESRLVPLVKQRGLASLELLVADLRRADLNLRRNVVEALTTNETTFFRDSAPFENLRKHIVPELMASRAATRKLRFWYGASSTGQEPYSVVMLLQEHFPELSTWDVTHYATDLNLEVLQRARDGKYNQTEINRGLPIAYLLKYFDQHGLEWTLKPAIRSRVTFEPINLVKPWPAMPAFDVVMLRNVMIYFDVESKKQILGKIRRLMQPDGFLFLGGAESTMGLDDGFVRAQFERSSCYRRTGPSVAMAMKGAA